MAQDLRARLGPTHAKAAGRNVLSGKEGGTHHKHSGLQQWWAAAAPPLALLVWVICSSMVIILNRQLMVEDKFRFPMTLTAMGQGASYLGGLLLAHAGWMPCRKPPPRAFFLHPLLPVVLCSAGSMAFGNYAYLHLSVAFISILKVATPAFTLGLCLLMRLERLTLNLSASITLITVGTFLAALAEFHGGTFSTVGCTAFLASVILEACRVVLIQLLVGELQYNAVEALVYLSPAIAGVLCTAAAIWEREGLLDHGWQRVAARPHLYAAAAFMGFAVNVTTYWAIKATSSLTFKVLGSIKNTLVVFLGVFIYNEKVPQGQFLGYCVSVAGFLYYIFDRSKPSEVNVHKPKLKE